MKHPTIVTLSVLLLFCTVGLFGCGKKADETKPISEVKAEAEKMDLAKLTSMAETYKDAITAKKADLEKLVAELKEIPLAKALGEEAKSLKSDMESLNKSLSALKDRFQVYYDKIKEKGGDTSGLKI